MRHFGVFGDSLLHTKTPIKNPADFMIAELRKDYISKFKGFLAMLTYKWQQDMFRMFLSKQIK
jgi:hypothetical protein